MVVVLSFDAGVEKIRRNNSSVEWVVGGGRRWAVGAVVVEPNSP